MLIGKWYPDRDIAAWAVIRSIVAIGGVFCITGFDQLLMREREISRQLLRLLLIQIPILALIFAIIICWMGVLGDISSFVAAASGGAISIAMSNYFRSHRLNVRSQIAQQWWKIAAFLVIMIAYFSSIKLKIDYLIIISMSISVFLTVIMFFIPIIGNKTCEIRGIGYIYSGGFRAMAMAIVMNLSMFGENILVEILSQASDTAVYFIHFTYFCLPMSIVSGYAAFFLATFIRDSPEKYFSFISKHKIYFLLLFVVLFAGCLVAGALGWKLIGVDRRVDWVLASVLVINSLLRAYYVGPAQYVALFFDNINYDKIIVYQIVSLILSLIILLFFYM